MVPQNIEYLTQMLRFFGSISPLTNLFILHSFNNSDIYKLL